MKILSILNRISSYSTFQIFYQPFRFLSWKREKEEISLQTITTYWSIAQPRYRKSSIQRVTREEGIFVEIAGVNVSVRGVGIDLSVPPPCKLLRNDWKTVSFQGEIFDLNGLLHPGERNVPS